jgi:radical SAM/SPASM domain protein of ACGX system
MEGPTFSIQWHLTTRCEQRCKHCYLFNSPQASSEIAGERLVTLSRLKRIADDHAQTCRRLGARPRVSLTGGNPLLHEHFWTLLAYLKNLGTKVHVMGNPFGITDEVARDLVAHDVSKFQLSLDGLEATHDSLRKHGSYRETERACRTLTQNGVGVAIMTTVSRLNMGEIPELAERVVEMGARAYAFARLCPSDGDASVLPTAAEYRQFLSVMWDAFRRLDGRGTSFVMKDHLWSLFLKEIGEFHPQDTGGVIVDGCGLGISHLTVLADGSVYACRRFSSRVGDVPRQSLYDIFLGRQMDEYREVERMEKCGKCELLPYCRGCMAVAHSVSGDWRAADPQCWK